jgi:hypothetical protein
MTVRIRGIYATALTSLFEEVVQASPPIRERFDGDRAFPTAPAEATVRTTDDRQGVAVSGDPDRVAAVTDRLRGVAVDALAWDADLPLGGVYAGEVTEELRSGAVVDCGDGAGFLPYSETERRIEAGDRLRVQVAEPAPPWADDRPLLETTVRVPGHLVDLVRGGAGPTSGPGTAGPELADLVPTDPPEGWVPDWGRDSDDADLDALDDALARGREAAAAVDDALGEGPPVEEGPHRYWAGFDTAFVWFGRESRFALDDVRREVTGTMPGHHRIKAGARDASAAVDFVEAVCPRAGRGEDGDGDGGGDSDFPFGVVARQFGPRAGDTVRLDHGKPDGRRLVLGEAEVVERDGDTVRVRREMSPGGTYDALGVERRAGDVAVTKLTEGKWWYPTVYRSADGDRRGTYVNVCTPVEVFPDAVRYVDLHVDVGEHADGTVERVDDDELDAAVAAGEVPESLAERARRVADAVENAL